MWTTVPYSLFAMFIKVLATFGKAAVFFLIREEGVGGGREGMESLELWEQFLQHTFGHNSNAFQTTLVQDCSGI